MVALTVRRHLPDLVEGSKQAKLVQLRLLRSAIERGPDELQPLLLNVLNLSTREQKALIDLLKETTLGAMIRATGVLTDRMKFLHGLEMMVFNSELKKLVKERSQLHRILAANTWIFGEEYNLSADDKGLTEVLKAHKKTLGDKVTIDQPATLATGKRGIVDLMLSRKIQGNREDDIEHLVVELKRPGATIGTEELTQIKKYAVAVAKDERFSSLKVRWEFVIIGNEMDDQVRLEARQSGKPTGIVFSTDRPLLINVRIKTWAEVIHENKSRLSF